MVTNTLTGDRALDVSIQSDSELATMLIELIEFANDAVETYSTAIDKLEDSAAVRQLSGFIGDHRQHSRILSACVMKLGETPPDEQQTKKVLSKGKIILASLIGDDVIVETMAANEEEIYAAYEQLLRHDGIPMPVRETLVQQQAEVRRHQLWLEQYEEPV
jgi:uncharacterized protein (TIGR02284 family)